MTDEAQGFGPVWGPMREALGEEHLQAFTQGQGKLQGMISAMIVTMTAVAHDRAALPAVLQDAGDVRQAADEWAAQCEAIHDHLKGGANGG